MFPSPPLLNFSHPLHVCGEGKSFALHFLATLLSMSQARVRCSRGVKQPPCTQMAIFLGGAAMLMALLPLLCSHLACLLTAVGRLDENIEAAESRSVGDDGFST